MVRWSTAWRGEGADRVSGAGFMVIPTLAALMSTEAFASFRMLQARHPTANVYLHPSTVALSKSAGQYVLPLPFRSLTSPTNEFRRSWPTLQGYLHMGAIEVLPCESLPLDSRFRPVGLAQLTAPRNSYPPLPHVTAGSSLS